jgi:hypothetical protein
MAAGGQDGDDQLYWDSNLWFFSGAPPDLERDFASDPKTRFIRSDIGLKDV